MKEVEACIHFLLTHHFSNKDDIGKKVKQWFPFGPLYIERQFHTTFKLQILGPILEM